MLGRMLNTVAELAGDNKSISEGTDMPADVKKKASDSVERLLHQIDNVVEDMPRWSSAASRMEQHYETLLNATAELQKASAFEAQIKCLPSSRHSVHLHESEEGLWGAYLVQNGAATLVGSGSSPQDALHSFDRNFVGGEKKPRQRKNKRVRSGDGPKDIQSTGPA